MDKIIYLPHPVSAEDKRRWNEDGFRIIDDRFKPADAVELQPEPQPIRRRGKRHAHNTENI